MMMRMFFFSEIIFPVSWRIFLTYS